MAYFIFYSCPKRTWHCIEAVRHRGGHHPCPWMVNRNANIRQQLQTQIRCAGVKTPAKYCAVCMKLSRTLAKPSNGGGSMQCKCASARISYTHTRCARTPCTVGWSRVGWSCSMGFPFCVFRACGIRPCVKFHGLQWFVFVHTTR